MVGDLKWLFDLIVLKVGRFFEVLKIVLNGFVVLIDVGCFVEVIEWGVMVGVVMFLGGVCKGGVFLFKWFFEIVYLVS